MHKLSGPNLMFIGTLAIGIGTRSWEVTLIVVGTFLLFYGLFRLLDK